MTEAIARVHSVHLVNVEQRQAISSHDEILRSDNYRQIATLTLILTLMLTISATSADFWHVLAD